LNGRFRWV